MGSCHRRQCTDRERDVQGFHVFKCQCRSLELATFNPCLDDIEMIVRGAIGLEFKSFLLLLDPDKVLVLNRAGESVLEGPCLLAGEGVLLGVGGPMFNYGLVSVLRLVDLFC